jgi:hypothetical protein
MNRKTLLAISALLIILLSACGAGTSSPAPEASATLPKATPLPPTAALLPTGVFEIFPAGVYGALCGRDIRDEDTD